MRLASLADLTPGDVDAWKSLAEHSIEPNPFFEPEFLIPALRYLDPEHKARVLVIAEDADMLLCLPVVPAGRWRRFPFPVLVAWRHDYAFLGTPLVHEASVETASAAFAEHLLKGSAPARFAVLERVDVNGQVLQALRSALNRQSVISQSFARPVLHRRPDGDYLASLGRERRRRLQQRRRALEREVGPVHVVDHAGDSDGARRFLDLEASGWKGVAGTAFASNPSHSAFYEEMAAQFAAEGRLELLALQTETGSVLAMATRLIAAEGVFSFKIAYDEQYRKFGPGRLLDVALLSEFDQRPRQEWVDSCTGVENEFKESLFPERRSVGTVLLPTGARTSSIAIRAVPKFFSLRSRLGRAR